MKENIQALSKLIILNVLNSHSDTLFFCRFEIKEFLLMNCSQQSPLQMQCTMHGIEPGHKPSASTLEKADQSSLIIKRRLRRKLCMDGMVSTRPKDIVQPAYL
jgi:hypothetical protein